MAIVHKVSLLALGPFLRATRAVAPLGDVNTALRFLRDFFRQCEQPLLRALHTANERAWKVLEITLAGETLCDRLRGGQTQALRQQLRAFLDSDPLSGRAAAVAFRQTCLRELRVADKSGSLTDGL